MARWLIGVALALHSVCSTAAKEPIDWDKRVVGIAPIEIEDAAALIEGSEAKGWRWPTRRGVLVGHVVKGGPGAVAGVKQLDIIIAIDREKIVNGDEFVNAIASSKGETIAVSFFRPTETNGRFRFRRQTVDVEPISRRELVATQVKKMLTPLRASRSTSTLTLTTS